MPGQVHPGVRQLPGVDQSHLGIGSNVVLCRWVALASMQALSRLAHLRKNMMNGSTITITDQLCDEQRIRIIHKVPAPRFLPMKIMESVILRQLSSAHCEINAISE